MLFLGSPGSRLRARLQMSCPRWGASFAAIGSVLAASRANRGATLAAVTRESRDSLNCFAYASAGPAAPNLGSLGVNDTLYASSGLEFAAVRSARSSVRPLKANAVGEGRTTGCVNADIRTSPEPCRSS